MRVCKCLYRAIGMIPIGDIGRIENVSYAGQTTCNIYGQCGRNY